MSENDGQGFQGIDYFRHKRLDDNAVDPKSSGHAAGTSCGQASTIKAQKTDLRPKFAGTLYKSPADLQKLVTQAFATATGGTETCEKLANELLHLHSPTTGFQSFALRQRNKSYSKPFFQSVIK